MIYADHAATTPLAEEALEAMLPYLSHHFGNPSGVHSVSRVARDGLEASRAKVAELLECLPAEVIFTSGASEANNLALRGLAAANQDKGRHIITTSIEHHAVLEPCRQLEREGHEVTFITPDSDGVVPVDKVVAALRPDTALVSVMLANNEVGSIQPVEQLAQALQRTGTYLHTDAAQTVGKISIDFGRLGVDALSLSAHKFYGPKGVGALLVRGGVQLRGQLLGGGQERGLRSGTENVPGVVGLAAGLAVCCSSLDAESRYLRGLREQLVAEILQLPGSMLTGHPHERLPGLASFAFSDVDGESLVIVLDRRGVAASTGSACSSASLAPSHVLRAMGVPATHISGSLRLSLGRSTTPADVAIIAQEVAYALEASRRVCLT